MAKRGPDFYDDDAVFLSYSQTRQGWPDNPNDTLEQPLMQELTGDLAGLRILDLGCGAAGFGATALAEGARSYLGVDASRNMIERARKAMADVMNGSVVHADLETWIPPVAAFDLVVSSLALHYVAGLDAVLDRAFAALAPGGRFVCSIEHPILTAAHCGGGSGSHPGCMVSDYFATGLREALWLGETVVKYHRTVEGYVAALQRAGFVFERLRESAPERGRFTDEAEYARRMCFPLFLFLGGRKPAYST